MTVGTNGLTCEFNWQCIADAIGYAIMITAHLDFLPSPHSLPWLGSTSAGRQPGRSCVIDMAYLEAKVEDKIYIELPEGYRHSKNISDY